jgi:hypothetical protein
VPLCGALDGRLTTRLRCRFSMCCYQYNRSTSNHNVMLKCCVINQCLRMDYKRVHGYAMAIYHFSKCVNLGAALPTFVLLWRRRIGPGQRKRDLGTAFGMAYDRNGWIGLPACNTWFSLVVYSPAFTLCWPHFDFGRGV